jgi:hypothetical protein
VAPPRAFRFVAICTLLLSLGVGVFASSEAMNLSLRADALTAAASEAPPLPGVDPVVHQKLISAYASRLRDVRESRSLLLGLLSIAAMVLFVGAARVLRPNGLPRANVGRLMKGAALAAAVLRTIEGAQYAAITRRVAELAAESLVPPGQPADVAQSVQQVVPWLSVAAAGTFTLFVAGAFIGVASYFGSERTRAWLAAEDARLERGQRS